MNRNYKTALLCLVLCAVQHQEISAISVSEFIKAYPRTLVGTIIGLGWMYHYHPKSIAGTIFGHVLLSLIIARMFHLDREKYKFTQDLSTYNEEQKNSQELIKAVDSGNQQLIDKALKKPLSRDQTGNILMNASIKGNNTVVNFILDNNSKFIDQDMLKNILLSTLNHGQFGIAQLLLNASYAMPIIVTPNHLKIASEKSTNLSSEQKDIANDVIKSLKKKLEPMNQAKLTPFDRPIDFKNPYPYALTQNS